ncbi:PaaI family thioesterase [Parasphingorhabdus halotolerans]|uniref:PaaI family thioesterase n=2 Tax=Parasphingorhabdus halotolerans TaxID=2725558 RepID=A0A6H2DS91_9SPHN|nr:PaaI family thioesterase [Parasphingorhabdus halotolerans]
MPFSKLMGVKIIRAEKDGVIGELLVKEELCTTSGTIHGGAIMAFADSLGAIAGFLNLPSGSNGTTTTESKTNFLGASLEGSLITGETKPIHVGRRLSVWQTRITRPDGKLIALTTQTQMTL